MYGIITVHPHVVLRVVSVSREVSLGRREGGRCTYIIMRALSWELYLLLYQHTSCCYEYLVGTVLLHLPVCGAGGGMQ